MLYCSVLCETREVYEQGSWWSKKTGWFLLLILLSKLEFKLVHVIQTVDNWTHIAHCVFYVMKYHVVNKSCNTISRQDGLIFKEAFKKLHIECQWKWRVLYVHCIRSFNDCNDYMYSLVGANYITFKLKKIILLRRGRKEKIVCIVEQLRTIHLICCDNFCSIYNKWCESSERWVSKDLCKRYVICMGIFYLSQWLLWLQPISS